MANMTHTATQAPTGTENQSSLGSPHSHTPRGLLGRAGQAIRARRQLHAERRQLMRDLDTYRTRKELDELYAMLERFEADETAEIRRVLSRRSAQLG